MIASVVDSIVHETITRQATAWVRELTLEQVFRDFSGIPGTPSPLQLAICRAAEGRELGGALTAELCREYFGADVQVVGTTRPECVALICGVRGGKSYLGSCAMILAALTTDLWQLPVHEIPRAPIIAPNKDAATATFRIVCGILQSSDKLRSMLVSEPTADTAMLRRPDGRLVEICVVAASKGGITVRNRWLVGYVLEELAQFGIEDEGSKVNAEEIENAARPRLLQGCQGWMISSPYGPKGLLFDTYEAHFGNVQGTHLVVHAPTLALNPSYPAEKIEKLRATHPDVAAREHDAKWVDPETTWFPSTIVDPARRLAPDDLPPEEGAVYRAAIDPATRGNAWTLVLSTCARVRPGSPRRRQYAVALVRQWIGSKERPLSPTAVFREIADLLRPYGTSTVYSDQWSADANREIAAECGLALVQQDDPGARLYQDLETRLIEQDLELPPDKDFRLDIISVKRRIIGSRVSAVLPKTANGRHCDYAPALVRSLAWPITAPAKSDEPPAGTPEHAEWEARKRKLARQQEVQRRQAKMARRMGL